MLNIAGWKTIKNKRKYNIFFSLFFIVFWHAFAYIGELKLTISLKPNTRFEWNKRHMKGKNVLYHLNVSVKRHHLLESMVYCPLKNLKLFSIKVKKLFEPIVLRRKADCFLLFLKAFPWETDLWVTLGDFTVKNVKLGRKIWTENGLSKNKSLCTADNHNYMYHICAKGFLDSKFN